MSRCCAAKMDDEYKSFLAELGGGHQDSGPPSGMGGRSFGGGGGGGGGGRQSRPGDDLPDNCKLYVGNLSPAVTDAVLKSLMEPFGNVLHAVVLLDMTSGEYLPPLLLCDLPSWRSFEVLQALCGQDVKQGHRCHAEEPHRALWQCLAHCEVPECDHRWESTCLSVVAPYFLL